jgi:peptide-methionine (S)-S-oxide reductase
VFFRKSASLPTPDEALPGRAERPFRLAERHLVLDAPLEAPVPDGYEEAIFGLGCFWGAEEVCSGRTGHTEAVRVVYDPAQVAYADLVRVFFEVHDPTQGMRQGNDQGTQYRSAIYYTTPEQEAVAHRLIAAYQPELTSRGYGEITTEVAPAPAYYYAEDAHQQYLQKNPYGYRCHSATGVPVPTVA